MTGQCGDERREQIDVLPGCVYRSDERFSSRVLIGESIGGSDRSRY